jgi:hypothetical protein
VWAGAEHLMGSFHQTDARGDADGVTHVVTL